MSTTMDLPVLHIMFGASAAGSLRHALNEAGRKDRVICPYDDFSFGPINPPDAAARTQWVGEQFGVDWTEIVARNQPFLATSVSRGTQPVVWISRRDAHNYTGFLWWLDYFGAAPCDVIDATDLEIVRRDSNGQTKSTWLAVSLGVLSPADMVPLLDRKAPLGHAERRKYRDLWQRLVAENAPLRVLDGSGLLVSAPITFFDSLVLSCAKTGWLKFARVVGESLARSCDGDLRQTGDLVLASRVRALAKSGALEWRGDLSNMHKCEVRLAAVPSNES